MTKWTHMPFSALSLALALLWFTGGCASRTAIPLSHEQCPQVPVRALALLRTNEGIWSGLAMAAEGSERTDLERAGEVRLSVLNQSFGSWVIHLVPGSAGRYKLDVASLNDERKLVGDHDICGVGEADRSRVDRLLTLCSDPSVWQGPTEFPHMRASFDGSSWRIEYFDGVRHRLAQQDLPDTYAKERGIEAFVRCGDGILDLAGVDLKISGRRP